MDPVSSCRKAPSCTELPLGPQLQPGTFPCVPRQGHFQLWLSALRLLSPPFLLLSIFQKRVEISHLLTPAPPFLIVGLDLFLFLQDHIKGSQEEGGDKLVRSEHVRQIIDTEHSTVSAQQMSAPLKTITCQCQVLGLVQRGVGGQVGLC